MKALALPQPLHFLNEGLAFLLEFVMLGILAWWGAETGTSLAGQVLLGAGAPVAAAIVWGLFAAPKALIKLPMGGVLTVRAVVFAAAAAALYALGWQWQAVVYAAIALVNTAIAAVRRRPAKLES